MKMMTTQEAAEYLSVTEGRIRQLVRDGKVRAQKTAKGWKIEEESLVVHRDAAKPGRPKRTAVRVNVNSYSLMSREHVVALVTYSNNTNEFVRVDIKDHDRIPFALQAHDVEAGHALDRLNAWWKGRCIPQGRPGIAEKLGQLGESDPSRLPLRNFGYSLTDQFWLKPRKPKMVWGKLNYFENAYDLHVDPPAKGEQRWLEAVGLATPDNALCGDRPKRWMIDERGRRLLFKHGGSDGIAAVNELIATRLYHRVLRHDEYVEYHIAQWGSETVSICENFVGKTEEFVPAAHVLALEEKPDDVDEYMHYFNICEKLGVLRAADLVDKMIVCDQILANSSRGWFDFGLVRDVETLELRPAPLFGAGKALWADASAKDVKKGKRKFAPALFDSDPKRQLELVVNPKWFDPSMLSGFDEEVRAVLEKWGRVDAKRIDYICAGLQARLDAVKKWHKSLPRIKNKKQEYDVRYIYLP